MCRHPVENFFPPLFSLSEIFFRIADLSVSTSFALLYHSLPKRSPTLAETCSRTRSASPPRLPLWVPMAKPTLRTTKASRRRECPTLDFWNTWTWAESRRLICTPTVRLRSWKRFRRNWATECKESECNCQAPPASFCKNSEKRMSTLRRTASPKIPVVSS